MAQKSFYEWGNRTEDRANNTYIKTQGFVQK